MFYIDVKADVKAIQRKMTALAYKQMPFATARALTVIAQRVQKAERANMKAVLDRPAPFTLSGVGVKAARKEDLEALVIVKDITARYLEPYEFGGLNVLNSRALLKPVNIPLNAYGNIPKGEMKQYMGRPDVYVGTIRGKDGKLINGVFQRESVVVGRRKPGKRANVTGRLRILIRFADAHDATQHLDWFVVAEKLVRAEFKRELTKQLSLALMTAKS
jgi:hypothetical protein